jgi:hypothetical protein
MLQPRGWAVLPPTKWAYQAIYRVGDNRVGQWSNPVSIGVGA